LALTTRVEASMLIPVLRVVVAVARSGIWKMAVPPSVKTLKMLPVKEELFRTSFTKSPEVRLEDEAVSQLPVVTLEVAVRAPVLATENLVTEASATEKVSVTRSVLLMVEEALTKMPAVVEVGLKANPAKVDSHDPFWPAAPVAQAAAAEMTFKELSSSKHLEAVREFKVRVEVMTAVPFRRVLPKTPSVVVGEAVPIPTLFSLALTTRVSVSKTEDQVKVEEAVPDKAENAPLTRSVSLKVEEART
jgi:hypothetical protein